MSNIFKTYSRLCEHDFRYIIVALMLGINIWECFTVGERSSHSERLLSTNGKLDNQCYGGAIH